jgi:hypothetical protein
VSDAREKSPGNRRAPLPDTPLLIGLILNVMIGVALFGYGLVTYFQDAALPYSTALVITGFLAVVLAWYTNQRSRVAWSFLLSLDGTGTLVFLFGASEVRDGFEVTLALGMMPAVLFGIAGALVATSQDFRS